MSEDGGDKLVSRRQVLKMGAMVAGALSLAACVPERLTTSTLEETRISSDQAADAYANTAGGGKVYEALFYGRDERYQQEKQDVEDDVNRKIMYRNRHFNCEMNFYLPADYGNTNIKELDGIMQFMKEEPESQWAPVKKVNVFAADFGKKKLTATWQTPATNEVALTYLNLSTDPSRPQALARMGSLMYIEICQALMMRTSLIVPTESVRRREEWANTVGEAIWSAKNGESYEEYVKAIHFDGQLYGIRGIKINLKPITEKQYKKVQSWAKKQ